MSLAPGLYKATVRGVPDQIVMLTDADTADPWVSLNARGQAADGWRWHQHDMVHGARPLIVLDFGTALALGQARTRREYVVEILRAANHSWTNDIADQIEAQTKPPRIPEPGLWGVVEAHTDEHPQTRVWTNGYGGVWFYGPDIATWGDLLDPTLVRDGIEVTS